MAAVETHPFLKSGPTTQALHRKASFTDVEEWCLRALLLDATSARHHQSQPQSTSPTVLGQETNTPRVFDDSVLFQVPFDNHTSRSNTKFGRHEKKLLGLWQAHEDGVHSMIMHNRTPSAGMITNTPGRTIHRKQGIPYNRKGTNCSDSTGRSSYHSGSYPTFLSDIEVVQPHQPREEDSSWGDEDGGFAHYDAWEVMRDEYAEDFGYNYNETQRSIAATLSGEDDLVRRSHIFRILGTSADDQSAQPHVLSPPLMDSLLNYVPESLSMQNYWMKFSLIRDGCSLYTLKQYLKATPYTILAIETTKGDVFGAFTSTTWKNHPTYFGSLPAFLWRMKNNRRTPCYSLFDQAAMESEIETYPYSGFNDLIQVCDEGRLAIGGGKIVPDWQSNYGEEDPLVGTIQGGIHVESLEEGQNYGFGIYLDEDLLEGSTSPCGTFRNPCLVNEHSKGEVFQIANLEVWTFTPCMDVKSAERNELTRFCLEQSTRSTTSSANESIRDSFNFSSQDEFQREFYRRIGQNEQSKHQRKGSYEYRHIIAPVTGRWKI